MSDEPLKSCTKCGNEVRRLIFGGAGVIFKGSGFYVTDKGGKRQKSGSETKPAEPKESASPKGDACSNCPASTGDGGCKADNAKAKTAAKIA